MCIRDSLTPVLLPELHDPPEVVDVYLQDWYGFFAEHGAHGLNEMNCALGAAMTGGPVWDPMAELLFEVASGAETFVVRATRASIEAPRRYRFAPGTLQVNAGVVEIDEADVRRALDLELYPHVLRASQIDALLTVVHASLDGIEADELEIAFEDIDDPEVSIAALPDQAYRRILDASTQIFDDWERPRVARFLEENRGEDGLLALRVRRRASAAFA